MPDAKMKFEITITGDELKGLLAKELKGHTDLSDFEVIDVTPQWEHSQRNEGKVLGLHIVMESPIPKPGKAMRFSDLDLGKNVKVRLDNQPHDMCPKCGVLLLFPMKPHDGPLSCPGCGYQLASGFPSSTGGDDEE